MTETPDIQEEASHRDKSGKSPDPHAGRPAADKTNDDDLDFVVTEAHDNAPEMVGGFKTDDADDLGIETPADLMEAEASHDVGERLLPDRGESLPIGDTTPPPPPPAYKPLEPVPESAAKKVVPDANRSPVPPPGLERLSDERVKELTDKMQGADSNNAYLSIEEKRRLLTSIDEEPVNSTGTPTAPPEPKSGFDSQPIVPPRKRKSEPQTQPQVELTGQRPKMSGRVRGVAHFARGYIKITGEQELREGDNLVINNREYILRPKTLSKKLILAIVAPLAAILIFVIGALLSSDTDTGAGRIVGLVVGEDERPLITGTEIRFPELGTSYESNGQGFFKSDPLDAGSYKIEFLYDGQVIATDYATVVADRITTITLRPEPAEATAEPIAQAARVAPDRPAPAAKATPPPAKPKPTPKKTASSASRWAKLALEANVEGARLTVDGSVLGAGNLTYPKLKPGLHSYVVSKEGYKSSRGTFDLKAGRTKTLQVTLVADPVVAKKAAPPERAPFDQGVAALDRGEFAAAISGFSEAISLNRNYAEAYFQRARAHQQNRDNRQAHDDYIRAGETHSDRKDFNNALTAYDRALAVDDKSIPAFLGRGNLYLSRGENIAAIADFDMAVRLDKRNLHGYLGLGQARFNQGYFKKAIKHFKDARSIDSKNPSIHRHLMMSYYLAGDYKQVKKSYEKFMKYASEAEIQNMRADRRFAPVLRTIGE